MDAKQLREMLSYDATTGRFTWKVSRRYIKAGRVAGCVASDGYVKLKVNQRPYYAHVLAWLYMTGTWPDTQVDHVNGDREDNAWANLRAATHEQNMQNSKMQRNNKLGMKGVRENRGKYTAQIGSKGKQLHLGTLDTPEEAHEAYREKAIELHGEFARAE